MPEISCGRGDGGAAQNHPGHMLLGAHGHHGPHWYGGKVMVL